MPNGHTSATIPVYALERLVDAAIEEGVGDKVGEAIAHISLLARRQGIDLKEHRHE